LASGIEGELVHPLPLPPTDNSLLLQMPFNNANDNIVMLVMAMSSSHLPSPCRPRSEPKGSARVWRPKQKASSTIVYGNICHTLLVPPPTSHYVFRFLTFFLLVVRARRSLAFGAARLERRHRHINNPLLRYMSYIIKGCREKHSNTIAHHPVVKPPAAASHGSVAHSN